MHAQLVALEGRGAGRSRARSARGSGVLIDGSNSAWRWVGSPLARTMAISASRSSSSGVARPGCASAIPIDALMNQSRPLSGNGARSSPTMRSAMRRASSASATGSRMIPNSSPPKRATVSPGRRPWTSRWPTATSSGRRSRGRALSLMTLNRSRSSSTTAIDSASSRGGRASAWRDAVGQELAVRQAGRRVVQGAALRHVDESRVVERDRGELGEAGQGVDVPPVPATARPFPEARPRTPTTLPPRSAARRRPSRTRPSGASDERPSQAS